MCAHKSQDKGLTVLSMHQPWASLLVYGLKRIEGRGWPTEHTGRLWIHSTSKSATPQEIQAAMMENWLALPDTIKQEIGSPYCFLCENPRRLVVPQQMRGYPKLWQLPAAMAKKVSVALKPPPDRVPFSWSAFGKPPAHVDDQHSILNKSSRSTLWQDKYGKQKNLQS